MKTYQVTLPDEFAAVVDRLIAAGKFDSVDHLMMYAVVQVEQEIDREELIDKDWLRKEIQKGIDSADRGESAPLDMAAIWARVERRLAEDKSETVHASRDANGTR
jgi:Arc/MetJ-type ribon-helix-helix transcriptional regulator